MNRVRRSVLKGGLAAGSLFLPQPWAWVWAQSEGALKLLRLPKVALVLGNSAYKDAPVLKNPANDARAIGEALKGAGFDVTMKLDASRAEMASLMQAFAATLAAKKCVGLFYFAGHGLQLAWRNYLVPVEAALDRMDDVPKQCIEVGSLVESIGRAANPMNVIILDACRENPFGKDFREAQKGLSQMDAPPATFLAYATSPGNVASDGAGANGLYTEHLLKEISVRDAKIEDVFKRVRLGVRRKSNGAQIPWESTSLEEDFWFLPPENLKKLSEEEAKRLYQEELAQFEKVQNAKEPAPLVEFLTRYPSGQFSELAQLQLDRALAAQGEKKIEIVNSAANPFTKGSARADTKYRVGDAYAWRTQDLYTKVEGRSIETAVKEITDNEVLWSNGLVTDLLGNQRRLPNGATFSPNQLAPLEFAVGRHWKTRYTVTSPKGDVGEANVELKIVTREKVTVPAGTFDAFRIESLGHSLMPMGPAEIQIKLWYAPDQVRMPVAREELRKVRGGRMERVVVSERRELVSFKQG